MAEILEVKPVGIRVKIEFNLNELVTLRNALDRAKLVQDKTNEVEIAENRYITDEFFPLLDGFVKEMKNGA